MFRRYLCFSILSLLPTLSKAEMPSSQTLRGSFDFYYQVSPQKPLEGRVFDGNSGQMTLNMSELRFERSASKVLMNVDLAFGEMVDQMAGPTEPSRNITQATLSYQVNDRLRIKAGKFYTPIGFELTRAQDNWQYSRSYLFNYGPFWHQGLSLTYKIWPEQLAATVFLINAWDGRLSQEANRNSSIAMSLSYTPSASFSSNYNFMGGQEGVGESFRRLHELILLYKWAEDYAVAMDLHYGEQSGVENIGTARWSGVAFYLKAKINEVYSISPRFEYFDDSQSGFVIAGGMSAAHSDRPKISAVTLTQMFQLDQGLEMRLEVRRDQASVGPIKTQESCSLALLYAF